MKRWLAILSVLLICVAALGACGYEEANSPAAPAEASPTESPTPTPEPAAPTVDTTVTIRNEFYLAVNGNHLYLNDEIDNILAFLGEPMHTFSRPSCAFVGYDHFFQFPGFQMQSYNTNGIDRLHTIILTDDSLSTVGGIFLGVTRDRLLAVYGYEYEYAYGMYTFTRGNTTLRVLITNGMVQTIAYELITN